MRLLLILLAIVDFLVLLTLLGCSTVPKEPQVWKKECFPQATYPYQRCAESQNRPKVCTDCVDKLDVRR